MSDCVKRIVELSKGAFDEKAARELLEGLKQSGVRQRSQGVDFEDAVLEGAVEKAKAIRRAAMVEKRNTALNIIALRSTTATLQSHLDNGLTLRKAFQALLVGTQANVKGGRFSIAARQSQLFDKYLGGLTADLEKEGLLPAFNSKSIQRQVAQELWELTTPGGKPGISKSTEAKKIAAIVHKYQSIAKERMNRAGADIGALDGYITRQSHDMARIRAAEFEGWRDAILPRLDAKRTFGDADPNTYLKAVYDGLSTGIHLKAQADADSGKLFAFKGPANLAKKSSQQRELHFKSADDWYEYNQQFGTKDVMESIIRGLDVSARNTAIMEVLGTNPRALFDRLRTEFKEANRGNTKAMEKYSDRVLENFFAEIDGTVKIPEHVRGANISAAIRAFQSMAKLGGAVISSVTDIPVAAAELRFQGVGSVESRAIAYMGALKGRGGVEKRQISSLIGVGMDGLAGAITSRWSANDDLPGTLSKMQRRFFKYSGLTWWTDTMKVSVGMTMSHRLAQLKGTSFNKLDDAQRNIFALYDIGESEWNVYRQAEFKDLEGRAYLTPDAVQDLPDEVIAKYLGDIAPSATKIQKTKDQLETKLQSYYTDRVNHAVITPDARNNAVLRQGLRPGTVEGEAIRFIMQFKAFPISMIDKVIGRFTYANGKADMMGLAALMAEMTIMGYVAMSAKDIFKGREPRQIDNPKTWGAAFIQGGGAGIYGDFLFGEYNRFGRSFTQTAAGPFLGDTASDIASVFAAIRSWEFEDAGAKALNTAISNVPYANLFYTRAALDYLILYNIQEKMNPGYLRRMERRMKKENDQKFLVNPRTFVN